MAKKILFLSGLTLLILAAGSLFPTPASAQCGIGPKGSCVQCHLEQAPVYDQGLWHGTHARKDCCTNCHGGNCSAADKETAHLGVIANPLEDVYNCHACHPDDYWQRAEAFAAEMQVTPASRATPTPVPTEDPANREPQIVVLPDPGPPPLFSEQQALTLITTGLTVIVFCLIFGFLAYRSSPH